MLVVYYRKSRLKGSKHRQHHLAICLGPRLNQEPANLGCHESCLRQLEYFSLTVLVVVDSLIYQELGPPPRPPLSSSYPSFMMSSSSASSPASVSMSSLSSRHCFLERSLGLRLLLAIRLSSSSSSTVHEAEVSEWNLLT